MRILSPNPKSLNGLIIALLLFIYLLIHLVFFASRFGTNDDTGLSLIASGGLSTPPQSRLIFINSSIGYLMKNLYLFFPGFPWYSILLLTSTYGALVVFYITVTSFNTTTKNFSDSLFFRIFLFLLLVCIFHLNLSVINYTQTAFTVLAIGIAICLLSATSPNRQYFLLGSLISVIGYMWRPDVLLPVLLFFVPFSFFLLASFRIRFSKIFLVFPFLLLAAYVSNRLSFAINEDWSKWMEFNLTRGQINGNNAISRLLNNTNIEQLSGSKINDSAFSLFNSFYFDHVSIKSTDLELITQSLPSSFNLVFLSEFSLVSNLKLYGVLVLLIEISRFQFRCRKRTVYLLLFLFTFILNMVKTYLSFYVRLPDYVDHGLNFSIFLIVLLFLLIFKKVQPASSVKNFTMRFSLIFVLFLYFLGPQLRQSFNSDSYSLILKEQSVFGNVYSDLLENKHPPYFGIPVALDMSAVSPFTPIDLGATGLVQTYGWPMRMPPIDDKMISIGTSPNPSLALIAGDLALADADLFAPIFEQFFYENYSVCGYFDGFWENANTEFAYFLRIPCT
jgi:hypothetical protein